jgi:hypothetical protein
MPDSWLESELSRQFCPVPAPDALWRRIHEQRRPLRVRPTRWMTWSVAIVSLLVLVGGLVWRFGVTRDPSADLEALAAREMRDLANGSGEIDIRSTDPREIQRWVKAKSGIDIQLPRDPAFWKDAVRLVGARVTQSAGSSVVVVTYRVGNDFAAMLVTDRRLGLTQNASPAHTSLRGKSTGDMRLYSWSAGAEDYAIAFTNMKEPDRACLLCHANSPALMVFR